MFFGRVIIVAVVIGECATAPAMHWESLLCLVLDCREQDRPCPRELLPFRLLSMYNLLFIIHKHYISFYKFLH